MFQHNSSPVHKVRAMKTWITKAGVEEVKCPAQSTDLDPIKHY